jgi:predicted nucleotidyltransferase
MHDTVPLHIPFEELSALCRQYQVRELAIFGSALRQDYRPDSDIDLLVSFEPAARVTLLTLARMQRELEALFGRKVDLVPKNGLKPGIRDHILATAQVISFAPYAARGRACSGSSSFSARSGVNRGMGKIPAS